jgi:hypothetical protein
VKKKRDKRKARGKAKLLSREAVAIARFFSFYKDTYEMYDTPDELSPYPELTAEEAPPPSALEGNYKLLERGFIIPALFRRAKSGTLSEIDQAIRREPKLTDFDRRVYEAYLIAQGPWETMKDPPTHDEVCSEYCKMIGAKERTDSVASAVRRSVVEQGLPITRLRIRAKNTK